MHNAGMNKTLTPHEVREVAVRAMVDPRSVQKLLAGETVRSITAHRIRVALVQLGHEPIAGARA